MADDERPDPTEAPDQARRIRRLDSILDTLDAGRRAQSRRERIVQEILANRRGEYRVPTWVLTLTLVLLVAAIVTALALL